MISHYIERYDEALNYIAVYDMIGYDVTNDMIQ